MGRRSILQLKRDLRVTDHPALVHAAGLEPVLRLYVAGPERWTLPDASVGHWAFLALSLAGLEVASGRLGAPLAVRVIDVREALPAAHGITDLVSHEETGNARTHARDRRVAAWTRGHDVHRTEPRQRALLRTRTTRDGWTGRRGAFVSTPAAATPAALGPIREEAGRPPSAADPGLAPGPCPRRQSGGRRQAERVPASFPTARGRTYPHALVDVRQGAAPRARIVATRRGPGFRAEVRARHGSRRSPGTRTGGRADEPGRATPAQGRLEL